MNKCVLLGRLTADPEVRMHNDGKGVARFTLAVDRKFKRDNEPDADFFSITAFNKQAETVERYFHKGMKICIDGEIRNNNYEDKNGVKHYGVQIIMNSFDFCERLQAPADTQPRQQQRNDGFMAIPDGVDDQELPFN